ncbi:hypothetical protein KN248_023080 [Mycobacterium paraintracellulare]|uniref:DUF7156 family protein n=1 Tax=Mycobacterium paraintracellulare TaxID=1138383 RepID=UPI001EEEF942|nr:hypothetical protein [Mycobacterium paraintracellulare]WVL48095.1 hypothetical protein KN248_023080 [Mycobacterium paraintracellulare]
MATDRDCQNTNMKELPTEFFLPPQTNAGLKRETVRLVAVSVAFIVVLGIIVALTQGIVVTV